MKLLAQIPGMGSTGHETATNTDKVKRRGNLGRCKHGGNDRAGCPWLQSLREKMEPGHRRQASRQTGRVWGLFPLRCDSKGTPVFFLRRAELKPATLDPSDAISDSRRGLSDWLIGATIPAGLVEKLRTPSPEWEKVINNCEIACTGRRR